jgi:AraC-like DNA-binding protein
LRLFPFMSRKKAASTTKKREPKRGSGVEVVESNAAKTPLGSILRHGVFNNRPGPYDGRRLQHFCLVYTLRGRTPYEDHVIGKTELRAGDLLLIHPGGAHWYGNGDAGGWDEYYLVFEGPLFDMLEQKGILDPSHPIVHLEPISYWHRRLASCAETATRFGMGANLKRVVDLLSFLTEVIEVQAGLASGEQPHWLAQACGQLESGLGEAFDVDRLARMCDLSATAFRKSFQRAMGVSPNQYRLAKIIDRACELSAQPNKLQKEVAAELGFATEQHFARRFKQITGMTFGQFRQQWPGTQIK